MEETNKVIDISVGVIIFIIALSVNVVLYASINKSIKEVLSINNVDPSIIATDQEIANEYVEYTVSEIFFMLQDIKEQLNVDEDYYLLDQYSPYRSDTKVSLCSIGSNNSVIVNDNCNNVDLSYFIKMIENPLPTGVVRI